MTRSVVTAAITAGAVVVALAGIAKATDSPSDNVIRACYHSKTGALRILDADATDSCGKHDTRLDWNLQGVPGLPGAAGVSGYQIVTAEGGSDQPGVVAGSHPGTTLDYQGTQSATAYCPPGKKVTAEVIIAETGGDMTAFAPSKHLASWAGMCPGNDESAGKRRSGKTRKGSKWLSQTLVECAKSANRSKNTYLAVATLRSHAGRNPYDRVLQDLIGELSTRSDEFRVRWAAHIVRFHRTGVKRLHHPIVGELQLSYETMTIDADDGLSMACTPWKPGSASQRALDLLASWTAAPEVRETPPDDGVRPQWRVPREPRGETSAMVLLLDPLPRNAVNRRVWSWS